jgi:hypothetical protein
MVGLLIINLGFSENIIITEFRTTILTIVAYL